MGISKRVLVISLVSIFLMFLTATVFFYAAELAGFASDSSISPWLGIPVSVAIFVGSQIIFILPLVKPPKITSRGKPLFCSIVVAALFASILTVIFGMMVMSIVQMSMKTPEDDTWAIFSILFLGWWAVEYDQSFFDPELYVLYVELGVLVISWIFWSWLLWVFVQRRHKDPGTLVRMTGWLFAGTLFEVLLAVPLMLIVRRRTDCYCSTGAFGALTLSVMACLWLCGPGIVIALCWRKRPWTKDHCFHCGYPRKVATASACSECGNTLTRG